MKIRLAINGYGRIGRNIVRAFYEEPVFREVCQLVAINDPGEYPVLEHLTQYDTIHGRFKEKVFLSEDKLCISKDEIFLLSQRDPQSLDWGALNIDVVLECTGHLCSADKAAIHLQKGAKKVLISAPGKGKIDATVVYGVNHTQLKASDKIVSNASCTTNALAPLVLPLHQDLGVLNGLMTTIHAVTNDQRLVDAKHADLRRARAAMASMIPTKTGAAQALSLVIPELKGRLDGLAIRVPTLNVSLVDFTFLANRETDKEEVNNILKKASEETLKGILDYNLKPLVSCDFNHTTASATVEALETKVIGRLVKVLAWYDNEWAFSVRMLDTAIAMMNAR